MTNKTVVWYLLFVVSFLGSTIPCLAAADAGRPLPSDQPAARSALTELSIQELMDIQVTTVSKKPQKLSEAAAAIYVITQEDIRRSGMTSIPELLRMVPGLHVAQFDANKWVVTSRGFSALFSDKLLVLIDGRSVYTPLFGGVFWDVQDTMLEDIERIEVIRGSGGTIWGANAVNGVINIITRAAQNTQGGLLALGTGNKERDGEAFRYGGRIGESGYFRFYGKHFDRSSFSDAAGANAQDKWNQSRAGFRVDYDLSGGDQVTVQGDGYSGNSGQRLNEPLLVPPYTRLLADTMKVNGGFLLAKWQRKLGEDSDISFQAYYDHTRRVPFTLEETRDTYDVEFQHRFGWWQRHELNWGLDLRKSSDKTLAHTFSTSLNPPDMTFRTTSAFVQDESVWAEGKLHFIAGSKFEHNSFTGFEYQPSVRALWSASKAHTFWGAVSRAVRVPSRGERNIQVASAPAFPAGPVTGVAFLFGNPSMKSEKLLAYELGYRSQPHQDVSLDAAVFYHDYRQLVSHEPGTRYLNTGSVPPFLVVPLTIGNKGHGRAHGMEISANWGITGKWHLIGSYTLLHMHMALDPGSNDPTFAGINRDSPRQQWQLRSYADMDHGMKLNASLFYVDSLPNQGIPAYTRFDAGLEWAASKDVGLGLGAQNLTGKGHREFAGSPVQLGSEVPRTVYGKFTLKF